MTLRIGTALALLLLSISRLVAAEAITVEPQSATVLSNHANSTGPMPGTKEDRLETNQAVFHMAQAMSRSEAFAASKELNTVDGWEAYLRQYPDGFRADLARAYIKKLNGTSGGNTNTNAGGESNTDAIANIDPSVRYIVTRNAAIQGHNTKQLFDLSVEQCKNACDDETSFTCKSFDYYKSRRICDLSNKSASDVGGLRDDYRGNPYDHYARVMQNISAHRDTAARADDIICENGSIRDGTCHCSSARERVQNAADDYTCKLRKTATKVICKYGWVSDGECRCKSGRKRVRKGRGNYVCVRKKTAAKKKPWQKYKNPWTRKDCSSLIPGCLRECKNSSDSNCKINCQQMCSVH